MPAAGADHSCLLCSDGTVVFCGYFPALALSTPEHDAEWMYTQMSSNAAQIALLRSNGCVEVRGWGAHAIPVVRCYEPAPGSGAYVYVAAGHYEHAVLRSDGRAFLGNLSIPEVYTCLDGCTAPHQQVAQIAAGSDHTVYLLTDGTVTALGGNGVGQCDVPVLPPGLRYIQVDAAGDGTLLLRSDGSVLYCGEILPWDHWPELPTGVHFTQISLGDVHVVLLCSDGNAVAVGPSVHNCCEIPVLPEGVRYVQVAAGGAHTVLLRSDGSAVAVGLNDCGQCDLPGPPIGHTFVANPTRPRCYVVQLFLELQVQANKWLVTCRDLSGASLVCWEMPPYRTSSVVRTVHGEVLHRLPSGCLLSIVLQDGTLVDSRMTWHDLFGAAETPIDDLSRFVLD